MNTDRFKFRAWLIQEKRIVDVLDFKIQDDGFILIKYKNTYTKQAYIPPEHLMQCTGLRDKNERLIFEGDIVKHYNYPLSKIVFCDTHVGYCAEMLFDEEQKKGWDKTDLLKTGNHIEAFFMDLHEQEIIGNIFENPELIEENNK